MLWVIVGHEYGFRLSFSSNPIGVLSIYSETGWADIVENGLYSVDVFFFMGGFFVAFSLLNNI